MDIKRGKIQVPLKVVIYGTEGIGKSTFASQFPSPLFFDMEDGTAQLDIDRVSPKTIAEVEEMLTLISRDNKGYKTIVFDTADWFEKILVKKITMAANKDSFEDFGYGKGYTYLAEALSTFLDRLSRFQKNTQINVVFLAHAAMKKVELPDQCGAYDRWELKMTRTTAPILKEWADVLLFAKYNTIVVENDGKKKAVGGQRVMKTTHNPSWDAKNRFGLPDEIKMEYAAIAHIMNAVSKPTPENNALLSLSPTQMEVILPVENVSAADAPRPVRQLVYDERKIGIEKLKDLVALSDVSETEIHELLVEKGCVTQDMLLENYNLETLNRVIAGWDAVTHNVRILRNKK